MLDNGFLEVRWEPIPPFWSFQVRREYDGSIVTTKKDQRIAIYRWADMQCNANEILRCEASWELQLERLEEINVGNGEASNQLNARLWYIVGGGRTFGSG